MHLIPLLALIPLIIFFPLVALNWVVRQIFNITLYIINRSYVYRADKFAGELGYKAELISYLETVNVITHIDASILGRIFATHPPAMKRIAHLDKIPSLFS